MNETTHTRTELISMWKQLRKALEAEEERLFDHLNALGPEADQSRREIADVKRKLGEIDQRLAGDGWTVIADIGDGVLFCGSTDPNQGKWKVDAPDVVKEFRSELSVLKWAETLRSAT